ncbi:MAG: hypothetical protein OEY11_03880 [Gammaproteobacteria bacterium]|nr:hypothetical protein [Gammaproteobacteria bacterium]
MNHSLTGILIGFFIMTPLLFLSSCSDSTSTQNQADLVITDIYTKPENPNAVYIKYMNLGGAAPAQDFLIKLASSKGSFSGNTNHRFSVPAPNTETETGAYKLELLSLANNENAQITAVIDWEERTDESDETNNAFTKFVHRQ